MPPKKAARLSRKCLHSGCQTYPSYGPRGLTRGTALRCRTHKDPTDMSYAVCGKQEKKLCDHPDGCTKGRQFGPRGSGRKGMHRCSKHKEDGEVDLKSPLCKFENCETQPSFGVAGSGKSGAIRCFKHKDASHVNVISPHCIEPSGCQHQRSFGPVGSRALRCATHKVSGDVCFRKKVCDDPSDCHTSPSYGPPGSDSKGAVRCFIHRQPEHVNVKSHRCTYPEGCNKVPAYGVAGSGQSKAIRCKNHKESNHVLLTNRLCLECSTVATKNHWGFTPAYCATHAAHGMVLHPMKRCAAGGCKEKPEYGKEKPLHCELHRAADEPEYYTQMCKTCGLIVPLYPNGICVGCTAEPDRVENQRLRKQRAVRDFLIACGFTIISYDRPVDTTCGLERPDIILLSPCGSFVVIIEVDEHQHRGYVRECEIIRMINIYMSYGGLNVIFIRFNPDDYKPGMLAPSAGEKRSRSNTSEDPEWRMVRSQSRLTKLQEWLSYLLRQEVPQMTPLQVLYLFYDGYLETSAALTSIKIP